MGRTVAALRNNLYTLIRQDLPRQAARLPEDHLADDAWLEGVGQYMLCHGLSRAQDSDRRHSLRSGLLYVLTLKKVRVADRLRRAQEYVLEHVDEIIELDLLLTGHHAMSARYQLDERVTCWWGEEPLGELLDAIEVCEPSELRARGLAQVSREIYIEHVRESLFDEMWVYASEELRWLARFFILLGGKRRSFDGDPAQLWVSHDEVSKVLTRWLRSCSPNEVTAGFLALPRTPLATIPGETNNVGLLASTGHSTHGRLKVYEERSGQLSLLVYDRSLVLKESELPDEYIRVPLKVRPDETSGALGALRASLGEIAEMQDLGAKAQRAYMKDVPRVIAGMFLAAREDEALNFSSVEPGVFLDAESGMRLTNLIGLNSSQHRFVKRVKAVRDWLTNIEVVRTIRGAKPGERIEWSKPLVSRLPDRINIIDQQLPGGLERSRRVFAWKIAPELWSMRTLKSGAEDFMLLDQRAFGLDSDLHHSTSEPFNLYWTVVQRAYMAASARTEQDRFTSSGSFNPRASTLYRWSGMESPSDVRHPHRIRERMREYFQQMVRHELILDWSSGLLESDELNFERAIFDRELRVEIKLPSSLLMYLPDTAFRARQNPFGPTRSRTYAS